MIQPIPDELTLAAGITNTNLVVSLLNRYAVLDIFFQADNFVNRSHKSAESVILQHYSAIHALAIARSQRIY